MTGTKPPRGAVVITSEPDGGREKHSAWCHNCGWSYANWVRSDVEQHKRWHTCATKEA